VKRKNYVQGEQKVPLHLSEVDYIRNLTECTVLAVTVFVGLNRHEHLKEVRDIQPKVFYIWAFSHMQHRAARTSCAGAQVGFAHPVVSSFCVVSSS